MSDHTIDAIVHALLYEGYILYPYRSSAVKNQCRWNFGVVYPRAYAEAQTGADAWVMQTECLVTGTPRTRIHAQVRFLRLIERAAGRFNPQFEAVPSLEVNGRLYESWQEATEHSVSPASCSLEELIHRPVHLPIQLHPQEEVEHLRDAGGSFGAALVRKSASISGSIDLSAVALAGDAFRLTVKLSNVTPLFCGEACSRAEALGQSLLSTHTIIEVDDGECVSLLDPPERLRGAAEECRNLGTWPVLVGEPACPRTMLSSPIVLYDYPQVAPESQGNLFDSTEIDEILTLRILTLTDSEKAAMRRSDDQARQLLERAETLPPDHFMKLHGVLRQTGSPVTGGGA